MQSKTVLCNELVPRPGFEQEYKNVECKMPFSSADFVEENYTGAPFESGWSSISTKFYTVPEVGNTKTLKITDSEGNYMWKQTMIDLFTPPEDPNQLNWFD